MKPIQTWKENLQINRKLVKEFLRVSASIVLDSIEQRLQLLSSTKIFEL